MHARMHVWLHAFGGFVVDRSQEGSQFEKGFGGLGGILRYKVDFCCDEEPVQHEDDEEFI